MHQHDKKLYGTATVGTKGQIAIPATAREALSIQPGDQLYVIGSESGQWVGLVKEEQIRAMINRLTDSLDQFNTLIK